MRNILLYENFTESERNNLINNNKTYIRKFVEFYMKRNLKSYADYINDDNI